MRTDRYCGETIGTVVAANGAIGAEDLNVGARRGVRGPETVRITEGVHSFLGGSIVNRTFIEGPDGVIVYDTGTDVEDGERAVAALRELTDKPVVAIIYSHNHYVHGAAAFAAEAGPDLRIIGHPRVNDNVARGADAMDFPEGAPALAQRFRRQFAAYLPDTGPDAPLGATYSAAQPQGPLPVNQPVADGEELTLAGLRVQFFTEHWSDSDDTVTVWFPELRLALNNFLWPTIPNFYALRGTGFRDPRSWRDGLLQLRDLRPEFLVNTHGRPVIGAAEIASTLEGYADAIAFTFDQSLRGILLGLDPNELRDFVRLPEYLTRLPRNRDGYGETQYQPPYVYERVFGWFDGRPESINPPPREVIARRIVDGFGGPAAVRAAVETALAEQEPSWAAVLAGHLVDTDPENPDHRTLKATAVRALGQRAGGSIARHFYLSYARELEGEITMPPSIPVSAGAVLGAPATMYIDHLRVRLNPALSGDTDRLVGIELTDAGVTAGLHVRRAVCEFIPDATRHARRPDYTVSLEKKVWARLFAGDLTWAAAIGDGLVTVGAPAEVGQDDGAAAVTEFFGFFDPQPEAPHARR